MKEHPMTTLDDIAGRDAEVDGALIGYDPAEADRRTLLRFVAALTEAVSDLTAAYHHERRHEGHWTRCQHPRCQNARLATEGRGPFLVRLTETEASAGHSLTEGSDRT